MCIPASRFLSTAPGQPMSIEIPAAPPSLIIGSATVLVSFTLCDLRLPRKNRPHPVAVVIHGGFRRSIYGLDYMWHACAALTKNGVATWNIETAESIMANLSAAVPTNFRTAITSLHL